MRVGSVSTRALGSVGVKNRQNRRALTRVQGPSPPLRSEAPVIEVFRSQGNSKLAEILEFESDAQGATMSIDINNDGTRLLAVSAGVGVGVWELEGLGLVAIRREPVDAACWTVTGDEIVACTGRELTTLNPATLEPGTDTAAVVPECTGRAVDLCLESLGMWGYRTGIVGLSVAESSLVIDGVRHNVGDHNLAGGYLDGVEHEDGVDLGGRVAA